MLRGRSLILAVSVVLGGCLLPASANAIVGGSAAVSGSFPWMAFVTMDDNQLECSGTVISPDLILTAGHCVYNAATGRMFAPGRMRVTTGTLDWTTGGEVTGVQRTMAAPGYDPAIGDGDAAILELDHPIEAPAITLATRADMGLAAAGEPVVVSGWGLTDAGDSDSEPDALQWAPTVVRSSSWCDHQWANFDASDELCTLDVPQDTTSFCNGDSGGPVIADEFSGQAGPPTEIGIMDDSQDCATDAPDFSAAVGPLASWIEQTIAQYPVGEPISSATSRPQPRPRRVVGPTLSLAAGRRDVRATLRHRYHGAFSHGRDRRLRCHRVDAASVSCLVRWRRDALRYQGAVTIRAHLRHGHVVWRGRYDVRELRPRPS